MPVRFNSLPADLYEYLINCSNREPAALARLREGTAEVDAVEVRISPEQGQFMAFLVKLIGARRCIELGTYTGYSALAVALALPPSGKLICCEISDKWPQHAQKYWREAGVEARIELIIQPAAKTLDELLIRDGPDSLDFAFIDADKEGYTMYYEKLLNLVRPGGLIVVDNTLVSGTPVIHGDRASLRAVRDFNAHVHTDERVDLTLIPIGEGVTLLRRRHAAERSASY
jgi:predicted O-methyltransferase YrrM